VRRRLRRPFELVHAGLATAAAQMIIIGCARGKDFAGRVDNPQEVAPVV
jgi:hypothetical protein